MKLNYMKLNSIHCSIVNEIADKIKNYELSSDNLYEAYHRYYTMEIITKKEFNSAQKEYDNNKRFLNDLIIKHLDFDVANCKEIDFSMTMIYIKNHIKFNLDY